MMTVKLNLNPLIKRFSKSNPKVASKLLGLTGKKTPKTAEVNRMSKIAQVLIEIANELDSTDPELAAEADSLLQEVVREAQADFCAGPGMGMQMQPQGQPCMDDMGGMMGGQPTVMVLEVADPEEEEKEAGDKMMEKQNDPSPLNPLKDNRQDASYLVEDLTEETSDPEIEEVPEPEEEFDLLSLEDFDDLLEGANRWSISRRKEKPVYESAKMMAQKSKDYYDAYRRYKDKAHEEFDNAGLKFRLKDFE